jgi:hypothetical protein
VTKFITVTNSDDLEAAWVEIQAALFIYGNLTLGTERDEDGVLSISIVNN